jgi:hypothetical protein
VERGGVQKKSFASGSTLNQISTSASAAARTSNAPLDANFARAFGFVPNMTSASGLGSTNPPHSSLSASNTSASGLGPNNSLYSSFSATNTSAPGLGPNNLLPAAAPVALPTYAGIVAQHPDNVKATSLSMTDKPNADMNFLTNLNLTPNQVTIGRPGISGRGKNNAYGRAGRSQFDEQLPQFETRKHKASTIGQNQSELPTETPEQRKRREAMELLPVFYDQPRGSDIPRVAGIPKINQGVLCYVLISGVDSSFQHEVLILHDYKIKYGLSSQNPSVQVMEQGVDAPLPLHIFREHLMPFITGSLEAKEPEKSIILAGSTPNLDFKAVKGMLEHTLQMTNIKDQRVHGIIQDAQPWEQSAAGLNGFSVMVRRKATFPREMYLGRLITTMAIRGAVQLAFVRFNSDSITAMDSFFQQQMQKCLGGPYWFYHQYLEPGKHPWANTLRKNYKEGANPIPIPSWQMINEGGKLVCKSEPLIKDFKSNADYRNIYSIALIREFAAASAQEMANYGPNNPHTARISSVLDTGVVVADFKIKRHEGAGQPPLPTETMTLRLFKGAEVAEVANPDQMDVEETPEAPETEQQNAPPTALPVRPKQQQLEQEAAENEAADLTPQEVPKVPGEWRAEILDDVELSGGFDFRVNFKVQPSESALFTEGQEIQFTITPSINDLSFERQLNAIQWMSRNLRPDHPDYELQAQIMGRKIQRFSAEPLWNMCSNSYWNTFTQEYFSRCGLNRLQREAVYKVFMGDKILTLIQGPPGTGKSVTDAVIATMVALLQFNCLVCAPANKPVVALMEKLIQQQQLLSKWIGVDANMYKIIYFPTLYQTKLELQQPKAKDNAKPNPHEMLNHSWHIKQWFKEHQGDRAVAAANDNEKNCRRWIDLKAKIERGTTPEPDDIKFFQQMIDYAAPRVFSDAKVPFIVATTCNNAAQLKEWKIQVKVVVGDEIAFGLEADSDIPLQLSPYRVVLSGDHKQYGPTIKDKDLSERHKQGGTSMFERLQQLYKDDMVKLKINYRMHPRITEFPAAVSYEYLGSEGVNVYEPSEAALFMEEFWNSAACELFRASRAPPADGGEVRDWRRLAYITPGTSAPAPGGTSLRNFSNVNSIAGVVQMMIEHKGNYKFKQEWLLIGTAYRDQLAEIEKQFAIRFKYDDIKDITMDTSHKLQGGEGRIYLFEFTPANEHNPALFGFNSDWRGANVQLTRAQDAIWMFGAFERHMDQIHILGSENAPPGLKNWGLLFADLKRCGDFVDIRKATALNLPKDNEEFLKTLREDWSLQIEKMKKEDSQFSQQWAIEVLSRATDPAALRFLQEKAWASLRNDLDRKLIAFRKEQQLYQDLAEMDTAMETSIETEIQDKIKEVGAIAAKAAAQKQVVVAAIAQEKKVAQQVKVRANTAPQPVSLASNNPFDLLAFREPGDESEDDDDFLETEENNDDEETQNDKNGDSSAMDETDN